MEETEKKFLSSKEARKKLKISDCDLMHMRIEGKLKYEKKRNAFLYDKKDVEKASQQRKKK